MLLIAAPSLGRVVQSAPGLTLSALDKHDAISKLASIIKKQQQLDRPEVMYLDTCQHYISDNSQAVTYRYSICTLHLLQKSHEASVSVTMQQTHECSASDCNLHLYGSLVWLACRTTGAVKIQQVSQQLRTNAAIRLHFKTDSQCVCSLWA